MARTRKIFACALQEHETPGAVRFIELNNDGVPIKSDEDGALIGEFYLRKAALPRTIPNRIAVSIEY